ncbi:hypothetical protein PIB30_101270 [Stylosanthes scabra]|uniref:Uncharacterized protein n=1 Tax=Stylosanthes scabra TaxID=79078 RepID=A0ABU6SZU5_9FABA|nr:hypothetical protein [Stylosanthes scabra]
MLRSHLDLDLLLFDPEIKRTLRRARHVRRRAELENTLRSQAARLASGCNLIHWSDSDTDSDTRTISLDTVKIVKGAKKHEFGGKTGCLGAQASAQAPKREATETQT